MLNVDIENAWQAVVAVMPDGGVLALHGTHGDERFDSVAFRGTRRRISAS
jgi:hypothetical protein